MLGRRAKLLLRPYAPRETERNKSRHDKSLIRNSLGNNQTKAASTKLELKKR
uniref:Uncharacterized protein n=1 Tax=Arion vulgaris TaxID=1028688 RepID=A0A0B7B4P5_9EUPU